ncbi:hypothetical protein MJN85_30215, partial [Salmonella enterica subsp. enterica serovar Anatum]|nr:hypothetical protein [Salmonella enterica subsp. enterica serovar Anatum]
MQCALYDAGRCRSCQWITQSVNEQLSAKTADLHTLTFNRTLFTWPNETLCKPWFSIRIRFCSRWIVLRMMFATLR